MPKHSLALTCALVCLAACPKQEVDTSEVQASNGDEPAPSPARLTLAAPPGPDAGSVDLKFSGEFTHSVKGVGVTCDHDAAPWISTGSTEVEGEAAPSWRLSIAGPPDPDGRRRLVLNTGATGASRQFVDSIAGLPVTQAANAGDPLKFAFTLRERPAAEGGADTGAAVEVSGVLRCPVALRAPVDKAVVAFLSARAGVEARDYSTYDFGRAKEPGAASVILPERDARILLDDVRAALGPGWVAFIGTTRWLGDENHEGVELVVAPGADQFDILRVARTDAVNYEMGTESIVRKFKAFDAAVGIDIVEASTDSVDVKLKAVPADLDAFAKEVYAFCPDTVDQGLGTLKALKADIQARQAVFFWWD